MRRSAARPLRPAVRPVGKPGRLARRQSPAGLWTERLWPWIPEGSRLAVAGLAASGSAARSAVEGLAAGSAAVSWSAAIRSPGSGVISVRWTGQALATAIDSGQSNPAALWMGSLPTMFGATRPGSVPRPRGACGRQRDQSTAPGCPLPHQFRHFQSLARCSSSSSATASIIPSFLLPTTRTTPSASRMKVLGHFRVSQAFEVGPLVEPSHYVRYPGASPLAFASRIVSSSRSLLPPSTTSGSSL